MSGDRKLVFQVRRSEMKRALLGLSLVHVSLISALTARFLIMFFLEKVEIGPSYWASVRVTLLAYCNSIIPTFIAAYAVTFARDKWISRHVRWSNYWVSLASISIFYGILLLFSIFLGGRFTFPRKIWLLSWSITLVIYTALALIGRLDDEVRERLIYNRVWHLLFDSATVASAFLIAYLLRFDGIPPQVYQRQFVLLLPYTVILYVGMNLVWRVYSFVWRFTSLREGLVLLLSVASSGLIALIIRIVALQAIPPLWVPFGVLLAQPGLTFIGLLGMRTLRRIQYNYLVRNREEIVSPKEKKRVLLIGAGNAGMMLVSELERHRRFKIIGFLDDDRRKQGTVISGIRVLGTTRDVSTVVREKAVQEVIFCIPTAPKSLFRRVTADCEALGIPASSIPSLSEIVLGKVKVGQLRPVRMEDLLGRASVEFDSNDRELMETYSGKRILVTGAAGSIGSELVRQLGEFNPTKLILLDKDENGLYEIGLEIREDFRGDVAEIVADIRDRNRMEKVFQRLKPEAVFHAAAYKHVPMMEYHPSESVLNNIIGTMNVVSLSSEHGAEFFLLISTDKAVNPTSVMGASKRVAEMIVRYTASQGKGNTRFCSVRFGNVLGSRASVVPLFQKRIAQGKNIQVTHPEIKRYFMTIPEAVQLVIQAGSLGRHGETFVLDMGYPVKIVDLARDLIEQSGLIPGKDIEIEYTGLRPGEKLFEELLLTAQSGARSTKYPKIFVDKAIQYDWLLLERALKSLEEAARNEDAEGIYQTFQSLNIGYQRKVVTLPTAAGK